MMVCTYVSSAPPPWMWGIFALDAVAIGMMAWQLGGWLLCRR